eukprot:3237366-Rhodomonas_salina.1
MPGLILCISWGHAAWAQVSSSQVLRSILSYGMSPRVFSDTATDTCPSPPSPTSVPCPVLTEVLPPFLRHRHTSRPPPMQCLVVA